MARLPRQLQHRQISRRTDRQQYRQTQACGIYCNLPGHKQTHCARFAWDLKHDQKNAHAGDERIEYLKSKGYNSHKPAAGTFKVYPHGNGNGPTAKKSNASVIADLEKQVTELKEKNKSGKKAEKYAALIEAISAMDDGSDPEDE